MIGFLVGTACLIALLKVVRHGRGFGGGCGGYGGYGGGHRGGHRGERGWGRGGWGGGFGPRFFLRSLFERLDTTPGQEKVIVAALDELKQTARSAKDEMKGARGDLAQAMRGESFDEVALGGATARVEGVVDTARKAGIAAFAKIHGALDDRQRQKLADMLESGPGFGPWGRGDHGDHGHHGDHPYRHSV